MSSADPSDPTQSRAAALAAHVATVRACVRCPRMRRPAVPGYPTVSRTLLVGQAPGRHEPVVGRPFAWTAGRTLFAWFREGCGVDEERFRRTVYMAAVCRCFPGETPAGGDRVPDRAEVAECSRWLRAEFEIPASRTGDPRRASGHLATAAARAADGTHRTLVSRELRRARLRRDSASPPERRVALATHRAGQDADPPRAGTHPRASGVSGGQRGLTCP